MATSNDPPGDDEMPHLSARFASDPAQVGAARRFILEAAGLGADHPRADDLLVCASEVFTNAVLHARKPDPDDPPPALDVGVETNRRGVRVTVTDGGGDTVPTLRRGHEDSRVNGRGVSIVDQLSDAWGFSRTPSGQTRVWFAFHNTKSGPDDTGSTSAATLR